MFHRYQVLLLVWNQYWFPLRGYQQICYLKEKVTPSLNMVVINLHVNIWPLVPQLWIPGKFNCFMGNCWMDICCMVKNSLDRCILGIYWQNLWRLTFKVQPWSDYRFRLFGQNLPGQMSPGQMWYRQMWHEQLLPEQLLIGQIVTRFGQSWSKSVVKI